MMAGLKKITIIMERKTPIIRLSNSVLFGEASVAFSVKITIIPVITINNPAMPSSLSISRADNACDKPRFEFPNK